MGPVKVQSGIQRLASTPRVTRPSLLVRGRYGVVSTAVHRSRIGFAQKLPFGVNQYTQRASRTYLSASSGDFSFTRATPCSKAIS